MTVIKQSEWFMNFEEESTELSKTEGEIKRKRGRPRKGPVAQIEKTESEQEEIELEQLSDEACHALLSSIGTDPVNYEEAINSAEGAKWKLAIEEELQSMTKNKIWKLVEKPTRMNNGQRLNIIDSRWIFKRKQEPDGKIRFRARLVIRGFKDKNVYELSETYAPVSRLTLSRAVLAIINQLDLEVCQLDVKTAFLNGELEEEIYM